MPLNLPPKCWRNRADCEPLHMIDAAPPDITEEQFFTFDYEPRSFVCAGCVAESNRAIPQDAYRVCWKNDEVDEMGEYDEQDLTHLISVVAQALAVIATRRVNSGTIDVATVQLAPPAAPSG